MNRFKHFIPVLFILSGIMASSQTTSQNLNPAGVNPKNLDWIELMQDPNVNFYDLQSAFNQYWANRTDYKGNGYKVFRRWEYINETRVSPDGKLQAPGYVLNEYNKYMKNAGKSASGSWTIQGPTAYVGNNTTQPTGMGRINAIAFHPTDVNTIYIGSPSGGFWKTTDGGASWMNLSSNLATLGVSSILIHPTDPDIIYLGTGDRDANDALPLGVYKSTDGGTTFTQINNTMGNVTVGAMLMHPSDPNTILAATSGGIFKTTDGGATWSLKSGANNFKDIKFKPGDPSVVYAVRITTPSRFYRSTDTGDSWTQITSGIPTTGIGSRMVIGVSSANPNYVYLVQILSSNKNFAGLLRSTDAGLNFSTQSTSPNIFDYACDGSGTASQATYDLCITVDPNNVNTIYVGSIDNWKSTDGGVNWTISTHWIGSDFGNTCAASVHADQHCYSWSPHNGRLYVGHDGGINYTADGGATWPQITNNLAITQIYKIGQAAANNSYTLFGCQDNGSAATTNGSTFTTVRGGDGMECLIDYSNTNYCFDTYSYGDIDRSTTGPTGNYSAIASTGTNGIAADESGAWVTPYFLHKTDPTKMFSGYENVFRCDNIRATPSSSVTWSAISTGETTTCRVLEQSSANTDIVYVFRMDAVTQLKRTDNANAVPASVTWSACNMPGGSNITDIKAHPTDPDIVYATAGAYIYKSTDRGMTWEDMDPYADLPDLTINCLVYDKNSDEGIYVGNQTGVWYKDATMTGWVLFSNGLPPVDIRELEIFYDPVGTQHRIKAATYGRGLWQSDLFESGVLNPVNFTATASSSSQIDLSWALSSGNNVMVAFNSSPTFGTPVNGTTYSTTIPGGGTVLYNGLNTTYNHTSLNQGTTYYYKIWSFDGTMNYSSGSTSNATIPVSVANFNSDISFSCTGSLNVNFTDASTGAWNSWAWDVDNNGTTDYTTQNPVHTYNSPGLYSVRLTINNGLATITKENLILVMGSQPTVNTGCAFSPNSNNGNTYGIGIYRVALNNIDYTTSNNDSYYQNYSCTKWTTLELNTTYNITIRTGTTNPEGASVYIDYNDNGIFEAGESVVTFPSNNTGTRTLSFTTPSTGVMLDKGLRLRVLSKYNSTPSTACDISTYGQAEDYTVYFTNQRNWDGSSGSDWLTAVNWSNSMVPASSTKVIIPSGCSNYPILINDVACRDLYIRSGASVTVNPGFALTVSGNLINEAGTEGLVIKSDATGTGSLIHSTAGVQATVERYIAASDWINWDDGWHLLSSPVASQAISAFEVVPDDEYDFYAWGEPTFEWLNYKAGNFSTFNGGTNFIPGRGYLTAYKTSDTKEFTGNLNSTDVTIGLTRTGSGDYTGFNLIGNPFASALTWGTGWTLGNVGGVAYVWDEASKDYISRDAGNPVPAMNGLMVYLGSGASQNLTIPAASRSHNPQGWYKSTEERILLVAHDPAGGAAKENIIRFNPDATDGFDLSFDGYYLQGYAPKFYSVSGGKYFSVNTLPSLQDNLVIPVGFEKTSSESYSIELRETIPGAVVYLKDKKVNMDFNLSQGRVYNFTSVTGDDPARFELHFKTVGIDELSSQSYFSVRYSDKQLFITSLAEKTTYDIFELEGRLLFSGQLDYKGSHTLPLNLPKGLYVVRLSGDNQVSSRKIVNF